MLNFFKKIQKFSNTWVGSILIVLPTIMFAVQSFKIPSGSMKDSLLVGDMLMANKLAYGVLKPYVPFIELPLLGDTGGYLYEGNKPERGDIIIFRYPNNTSLHYVKRCVALPNDELFLLNKNLFIHFNEGDKWIKENYQDYKIEKFAGKSWVKNPYMKEHPGIHHDENVINNGHPDMQPLFNLAPIKIPENEYFMMGDNRDHSNDSRFWGTVPYNNIEGTPWFIYFSMDDNWEIRWDRVGKTPTDLENNIHLSKAILERQKSEIKGIQ